jgi:ABC-2 type transport system ATP-binding protein
MVLEVESLTKRYGEGLAVDGLTFRVEPGRIVGFLGPNGAGKSTTLRILLGLAAPTAGTATIDGRRYRDLVDPVRCVGAVLEGSTFHPGRSARDHLRWVALAAGLAHARVPDVLGLVGLLDAADRRVGSYSQGMRQRLALACALLGEPRVLVLDEPANGLDPQGIRWLRDLLRAGADEGRTILVASHILAEVAQTVDDVVILHRGRLVAQGPLEGLTGEAGVRVRTSARQRLASALAARGHLVERDGEDGLLVRGATVDEVGDAAAAAGVALHELRPSARTLEDAFLELTGTGGPAAR